MNRGDQPAGHRPVSSAAKRRAEQLNAQRNVCAFRFTVLLLVNPFAACTGAVHGRPDADAAPESNVVADATAPPDSSPRDARADASSLECASPRARVPLGLCSPDHWCWENPRPQGDSLRAVWATASDDVWAVGESGLVLRWDGLRWSRIDVGTTARIGSVWASGRNDIWLVGDTDAVTLPRLGSVAGRTNVFHGDGSSWTRVQIRGSPTDPPYPLSVWGSGTNDLWLGMTGGVLVRWNGTSFAYSTSLGAEGVSRLTGTGSNEVYARTGDGYVGRWNGTSWSTALPFGMRTWGPAGLFAVAPNDVWVAALGGRLSHWNGSAWSAVQPDLLTTEFSVSDLWGADADVLWVVGSRQGFLPPHVIARRTGSGWAAVVTDAPRTLTAISGSSSTAIWTVGDAGLMMRFDGTSWRPTDGGIPIVDLELRDTWAYGCDRWILGVAGGRLNEHGVILRQVGDAWTAVADELPSLFALWGSAIDDIWAVGARGVAVHWDGHAWSTQSTGFSGDLRAVWGSRRDDVWAVGEGELNQPATFVHYDGAQWTRVAAAGAPNPRLCENRHSLRSVWGSGENDVWAAGGVEIPCGASGGRAELLHWDGSNWSAVSQADGGGPGFGFVGVAGTSAGDVWTFGRAMHHREGASWVRYPLPDDFIAARMWFENAGSAWIVGYAGRIVHWDGVRFTEVRTDAHATLESVFGTSSEDVWAVGDGGAILRLAR